MKENKVFYGWWVILGSVILLAVLGPVSVAVANLYQGSVTADFGISNSAFAIVNTIVLGVSIFTTPFVSNQVNKPGNYKKFLTIGILIYAIAYAGYGLAPNIYIFYFLSLFVGFGASATVTVPAVFIVSRWFVKKRATAISLALTGLGFGTMTSSYLLTYLIAAVGWRQTYFIYAAIMIVVSLPIVWFVLKEKPEDIGLKAYGAEKELETTKSSSGTKKVQSGVTTDFSQTVTSAFFILLIVGAILVGIINTAGFGQFPPYLTGLHGEQTTAVIVSVYAGIGIIGKITLGNLTDRFGVKATIIYAIGLTTLSYILMMFAANYRFAVIAAILFGLGNAVSTVTPPLITTEVYAPNNYAKAYGYVQSGVQLGMASGSLIAASIADATSYEVAWIIVMAITVACGILWISSIGLAKKYQG